MPIQQIFQISLIYEMGSIVISSPRLIYAFLWYSSIQSLPNENNQQTYKNISPSHIQKKFLPKRAKGVTKSPKEPLFSSSQLRYFFWKWKIAESFHAIHAVRLWQRQISPFSLAPGNRVVKVVVESKVCEFGQADIDQLRALLSEIAAELDAASGIRGLIYTTTNKGL